MRLLCSAAQDFILEIILAAEDLQLLSQSIHRGIFAQFSPAVKSKSCSFQSILPLILDLADSTACAIPVDGDGIDDGNEYPIGMQFSVTGSWYRPVASITTRVSFPNARI